MQSAVAAVLHLGVGVLLEGGLELGLGRVRHLRRRRIVEAFSGMNWCELEVSVRA
jgi:hypothetical protein